MKKYLNKRLNIIITIILAAVFLVSGTILGQSVVKADSSQKGTSTGSTSSTNTDTDSVDTSFKKGDKLNIPGIGLKNDSYADDVLNSDVTGDGTADTVILAGVKQSQDDIYSSEFTVIVYDTTAEKYLSISAGAEGGYSGKLFAGDIDGDRVPDIFISAGTGGSGGCSNYSILSFSSGVPRVLAAQDILSRGASFKGHFKDGFKIEVRNIDLDKTYVFDESLSSEVLVDNMVYDASGKLLQNLETVTDNLVKLDPVDTDGDGIYELKGNQIIWGFCHPCTIARADTLWKFEKGSLKIKSLDMTPSPVN